MPPLSKAAKAIVAKYKMEEHPEGGFFTETYRADQQVDTPNGPRSASTAIKFLVTKGEYLVGVEHIQTRKTLGRPQPTPSHLTKQIRKL